MPGLVIDEQGPRVGNNKEALSARMERLLFTPEGGVLGHPDWGSRLHEFFYEPQDEITAQEMLAEISFLLTQEDSIDVEEISVDLFGTTGGNGVGVKISVFEDAETDATQEVEFFRIVEIS